MIKNIILNLILVLLKKYRLTVILSKTNCNFYRKIFKKLKTYKKKLITKLCNITLFYIIKNTFKSTQELGPYPEFKRFKTTQVA